jgi:hypothetical protein
MEPEALGQLEKHEIDCTPDEDKDTMIIRDKHEEPTVIASEAALEDRRPPPQMEILDRIQRELQSARLLGRMNDGHDRFARCDGISAWKRETGDLGRRE